MQISTTLRPPNALIVKSNHLVNAEYRLTPLEMKIVYLMAMQIKQGDEDFKTYYLRISDFKDDLGLKDNKALYSRMVDIVNRLMQRVIKIEDENGDVEQFHFVTYSKHKSANGTIAIRFVPELKPHFLELKAQFTSFYDTNVLSLRSSYSMRIYEFLKQYETIGRRIMEVDELKKKLEIQDKYRSYNMFKKKVIMQAEKDLRKSCDIYFSYNEIKEGRKINAIEFQIHRNRKTVPFKSSIQLKEEKEKEGVNFTIKQMLSDIGITDKQITKYVDEQKKDPSYLKALVEETKTRFEAGKIKNAAAYLVTLIEDNAQPKSAYENKVKKKRKEEGEKRREVLLKKKEQKIFIERLLGEFKDHREGQKQKISDNFTDRDWMEFESYALSLPQMFRKDLIENGKINYDAENLEHIRDVFIGTKKLPNFEETFVKWAYESYGIALETDKNSSSQYVMIAKQPSLFEKEEI
ncbi:replication initiation protein [Catalinimonas sp. 4WD22]|uniref:replication initiation protein n=1 Tax=Catalinimonas locisalis TaxID=3133978 RepID=UPI00310108A0